MKVMKPAEPRDGGEGVPLVIPPEAIYREKRSAILLAAGLFMIYRLAITLAKVC
jgi:hypothetical protein